MDEKGVPINDLIHFLLSKDFVAGDLYHTHIGYEHPDVRTTQFQSMDIVPPFIVFNCLDQAELDYMDFFNFLERL
jgi:hypothetical protein